MNNPEYLHKPNNNELAPFSEWQSFLNRSLFARHGRTTLNESGVLQGSSNLSLSQNGRVEVEQSAENIVHSGTRIEKVISSPMLRALETSQIISSHLQLPLTTISIIPNIQEYNFGILEGQNIQQLETDRQHSRWLKNPLTVSEVEGFPQNAEDLFRFLSRVNTGMREVMGITVENNKKILIVSHAMVTRAIRFLALISKEGINTLTPDVIKKYERSFFYEDPDIQTRFIKIPHKVFEIKPSLEFYSS